MLKGHYDTETWSGQSDWGVSAALGKFVGMLRSPHGTERKVALVGARRMGEKPLYLLVDGVLFCLGASRVRAFAGGRGFQFRRPARPPTSRIHSGTLVDIQRDRKMMPARSAVRNPAIVLPNAPIEISCMRGSKKAADHEFADLGRRRELGAALGRESEPNALSECHLGHCFKRNYSSLIVALISAHPRKNQRSQWF